MIRESEAGSAKPSPNPGDLPEASRFCSLIFITRNNEAASIIFLFHADAHRYQRVPPQTGGGRIAGVVIDNAGEEPLPGATIFIEELKKGIVTDGHGEFLLSDVPAATYTLTVRIYSYHTQTLQAHGG